MANVQVIQRHAHLASAVRLEFVNGREGKVAKAVLTAISNSRRGSGDSREEESTAIHMHTGIGLRNVRRRLDLLYKDQHELRIDERRDTFQVNLCLKIIS